MKVSAAATLFVAVAGFLNAQTTDIAVNIQQVVVSLPAINVYADVFSGAGDPLIGLKPQNFTASVAGQTIPFRTAVPFADTSEGMATVILLDTSASIGRSRFRDMKDTVTAWIGKMGPKDQIALLSVGNKTGVVSPFTADKTTLLQALGAVNTRDETTALYLSLATGLRMAQSQPDLPARRILLVLTDGKDDNPVSGITENDLYAVMNQIRLPVYAIGVASDPSRPTADPYSKLLSGISYRSNGLYAALGSGGIKSDAQAELLWQSARRVYAGTMVCDGCPRDGRNASLTIAVNGHTSLPSPIALTPGPPLPPVPWYRKVWPWVAIGGVLLLAGGLTVFFLKRRRPADAEPFFESHTFPRLPNPQPRGTRLVFVVIGRQHRYEAEMSDRLVLGRDAQCGVCISDDDTVAPRQCELYRQEGAFFIRNLSESRTTLLNTIPVTVPRRINNRDVITAGRTELRLLIGDAS